MKRFLSYIVNSGATVSVVLNPFHWTYVPKHTTSGGDLWDVDWDMYSFLFLNIKVWVDDGDWE